MAKRTGNKREPSFEELMADLNDTAPPKIKAEDPDGLVAELHDYMSRIQKRRTFSPHPSPKHLAAISKIIQLLARKDPGRLIEEGYASVTEILMRLVIRLRLHVEQAMEAQDQCRDEHALRLSQEVNNSLSTIDCLTNLLFKLGDSFGRFRHLQSIERKEKPAPAAQPKTQRRRVARDRKKTPGRPKAAQNVRLDPKKANGGRNGCLRPAMA